MNERNLLWLKNWEWPRNEQNVYNAELCWPRKSQLLYSLLALIPKAFVNCQSEIKDPTKTPLRLIKSFKSNQTISFNVIYWHRKWFNSIFNLPALQNQKLKCSGDVLYKLKLSNFKYFNVVLPMILRAKENKSQTGWIYNFCITPCSKLPQRMTNSTKNISIHCFGYKFQFSIFSIPTIAGQTRRHTERQPSTIHTATRNECILEVDAFTCVPAPAYLVLCHADAYTNILKSPIGKWLECLLFHVLYEKANIYAGSLNANATIVGTNIFMPALNSIQCINRKWRRKCNVHYVLKLFSSVEITRAHTIWFNDIMESVVTQ